MWSVECEFRVVGFGVRCIKYGVWSVKSEV